MRAAGSTLKSVRLGPPWRVQRYLAREQFRSVRAWSDRLPASADVIPGGWPPLLDLRARAARVFVSPFRELAANSSYCHRHIPNAAPKLMMFHRQIAGIAKESMPVDGG
jgi:hypothetical protein